MLVISAENEVEECITQTSQRRVLFLTLFVYDIFILSAWSLQTVCQHISCSYFHLDLFLTTEMLSTDLEDTQILYSPT